jgi:hypothetical protein
MKHSFASSRIWLENGKINYESRYYGSWQLLVGDVRVIGEYTTDHGPFLDDWFLVFVKSTTSCWYEASNYADGLDETCEQLTAILGAESLSGNLFASTEFASRIIWPQSLLGRPLFCFRPGPTPWWRRLLGIQSLDIELSREAKQAVV